MLEGCALPELVYPPDGRVLIADGACMGSQVPGPIGTLKPDWHAVLAPSLAGIWR